jgi:hypothetical protein
MSILGPALSRQRAAYFRSLKRWCQVDSAPVPTVATRT